MAIFAIFRKSCSFLYLIVNQILLSIFLLFLYMFEKKKHRKSSSKAVFRRFFQQNSLPFFNFKIENRATFCCFANLAQMFRVFFQIRSQLQASNSSCGFFFLAFWHFLQITFVFFPTTFTNNHF